MRKSPIRLLLFVFGFLWTLSARAGAEYVWTGASGDGKWATVGNWSKNGGAASEFPNSYDAVVRFTNNVNLSVYLASSYAMSRLSIEAGTNVFTHAGNGCGLKIRDSVTTTGTLYVAENAMADVRCGVGEGWGGKTLMKTGLGLYKQSNAYFGNWIGKPGTVYVKEGKWQNSSSLYFSLPSKIHVADGATVSTSSGGYFNSKDSMVQVPSVQIDAGGLFQSTASWITFDGITGEGTCSGWVTLLLSRGPYRFDGTATGTWCFEPSIYGSATNRHVVVGRPDNLANIQFYDQGNNGDYLRFAADQGGVFTICKSYDMRYTSLASRWTAEDENGIGVVVNVNGINFEGTKNSLFHLAGKGTFLLPYVTNGQFLSSTNNTACLTGFVGAKVGNGITFGDRYMTANPLFANLLNEAGTVCNRCTLTYQATNLVQRGSLTGTNGTVWVYRNTTFMNFNMRDGAFGACVDAAGGGVHVYDGIASIKSIYTSNNWGTRPFNLYGGVVAGPLAVDEDLATVVPSTLPRPVNPIPNYEYASPGYYRATLNVRLPSGNGEFHIKPYSTANNGGSTTLNSLNAGTMCIHDGPIQNFTSVNGSRIAMYPPTTEEFRPAWNALGIGANGAEFISGPSANGAAKNYAIQGISGSGTVTRYGAGYCRIITRPTGFTGTLRLLDGRFGLQEDVADTSLTGTGPLELGTVKIERASAKRLLLNAATVKGGALIVPGTNRAKFTSLAFEKGGALFLDKTSADYAYATQPTGVPIFDYASGTITKNATFCTADHAVLAGAETGDTFLFSGHGVLAVQSDTVFSGILAGSSGVSVVGPADGVKRVVTLGGANLVKGGTYVSGVEVRPANETVFAKGAVTVAPGEWMGGRLRFTQPCDFSANAFTAGGWGPVDEQGALIFEASTTLGSLAVSRPLRLRVETDVTATVVDKVTSDEHIQIAGNGGTLTLCAGKDGAGRLDVIKSRVRFEGDRPALGTGHFWLDDGTIEFANTQPLVVSNLIYGVGRIVCSGADVNFASVSLDFDGTIDVPGSAHVSFHTQSKLGENLTIRFSRTYDRGAVVDLGGVYRTVDRVVGYGTVTGASYEPKHPTVRGGFQIIFR